MRLGLLEAVHAAGDDDRCLAARGAQRGANPRSRFDVAAKRAEAIRMPRRHAFVAAAPGVGIDGPADRGLLGIVELAAARQRQKVHARAGEGGAEGAGIVDAAAAFDAFISYNFV